MVRMETQARRMVRMETLIVSDCWRERASPCECCTGVKAGRSQRAPEWIEQWYIHRCMKTFYGVWYVGRGHGAPPEHAVTGILCQVCCDWHLTIMPFALPEAPNTHAC